MAEIRAVGKSQDAMAVRHAVDAHVILFPDTGPFFGEPGFRVRCDFEADTSQGRISILDNDGTVEVFLPVRQGVPILREILAAYEQRLTELPTD